MSRPSPSPVLAFLLVALPAGLALLVLTPPFQVPDESSHLFRAFQISEGHFRAGSEGGFPGGNLPASLARAATAFPPNLEPLERHELLARVTRGLEAPLAPEERRFFRFLSAAYSPMPYLPAAAALAAGRAASWSPLALLYAGRLATLLFATLLHALSLKLAPAFRWPLVLLALTPMAAFLRSGLSPDGVTTGLAFLFFALVLRLSAEDGDPPPRHLAGLVLATSGALGLCKGYAILLPLLLFVPVRGRAGRRLAWGAAAVGAAAAAGWSLANRALPAPPRLDVPVDAAAQLRTIFSEPGRFLSSLGTELLGHGARHARELFGQLGWLDVRLPAALLALLAAALVVLALAEGTIRLRLAPRWRFGVLAVLAAGILSIFGAMYILHTPPGAGGIEGIQGRYFIPFTPPALFLLVSRRPRLALSERGMARVALLSALLGLAGAVWSLEARFIAPPPAPGPAPARLLQSSECPPFRPSPSSSISS
jgi:uncharacterized membrane protein